MRISIPLEIKPTMNSANCHRSTRLSGALISGVCCSLLMTQFATAQLPFERAPIEYSKSDASDPVATLIDRMDDDDANRLRSTEPGGYLNALLDALQIPVSSQTLVFSKTSLQKHLISPSNPRAIYFNDDVYVAWVPDGQMIEIASIDPLLGTVFYTIDQGESDDLVGIERRNQRCLFCHASSDSGRVPGLLMQSVYTDAGGNRVFTENAIPANSKGPLQGRFAGWFVTGKHGRQRHLGNLTVDEGASVDIKDTDKTANVVDLSKWFEVDKYASPHSDLVALLVLRHQVTVHNVVIDANHRALLKLNNDPKAQNEATTNELDRLAEKVVDGLLMVDEAEFVDSVSGTSSFAEDFAGRGPKDSQGRSLRQFDLKNRLFRYPCSYLIYTESFDALPERLLSRIDMKMRDVLTSKDKRKKYQHLAIADRTAILEILKETKPGRWGGEEIGR